MAPEEHNKSKKTIRTAVKINLFRMLKYDLLGIILKPSPIIIFLYAILKNDARLKNAKISLFTPRLILT